MSPLTPPILATALIGALIASAFLSELLESNTSVDDLDEPDFTDLPWSIAQGFYAQSPDPLGDRSGIRGGGGQQAAHLLGSYVLSDLGDSR